MIDNKLYNRWSAKFNMAEAKSRSVGGSYVYR